MQSASRGGGASYTEAISRDRRETGDRSAEENTNLREDSSKTGAKQR
jgi:hypothetical protein